MGIKSNAIACAVGILISQLSINSVHNPSASSVDDKKILVDSLDTEFNKFSMKKYYRLSITKGFEWYECDSNSNENSKTTTIKNEVEDAIKMASQKYGVDEKLIKSLIKQESNFNPKCVSHVGAIGLMQIMPNTVKKFNVKDPYNVYENVDAGTKHLKGMIERYSGDIVKAVIAYNCGGNALDKSGFKSLDDVSMLPKETRIHVKNIIHYYHNGY